MRIKYLFNDLKKYCKKEYYHRNGEETLVFTNSDIEFEISKSGENLSVVISDSGCRNNYTNSERLDFYQKSQIKSAIDSCTSLKVRCATICMALMRVLQSEQ